MKTIGRTSLGAVCAAMLFIFPFLVTRAFSESDFYTSDCTGCHPTATPTCNGCHGHGVHSSKKKSDINLKGTTSKTSYATGENVTVTIDAGYRDGWVSVILYDQNGVKLARSSGNDSGQGHSTTFPATLSSPAPLTPGSYTWKVAWYGNESDSVTFGTGWTADPANPGHGQQVVSTNSFTVVDGTAPTVDSFSMPATATSLTVPVSAFTASDNAAVTGYMITTTPTAPLAGTAGWSGTAPTTATAPGTGSVTFYAWAKDGAGHVSTGKSATVVITFVLLSVGIDGSGSGSVNSNPAGIACASGSASGCSAPYDSTVTVQLTASPGTLSIFSGWGGDCSSFSNAPTCTLAMPTARTVSATFGSSAKAAIGTTRFGSLTDAYAAAVSGDRIRVLDCSTLISLGVAKIITLDGGYDTSFTLKSGQPSTLSGTQTITTGSLTVSDIAIL